jgi:hypothetical protein
MCYQVALGVRHVRQFLAETPFLAMMMSAQYDLFKKKSHDIFVSPKYCTSWLVIPQKNNECEFFHNF